MVHIAFDIRMESSFAYAHSLCSQGKADENAGTFKVDTGATALAATALEFSMAGNLISALPVSLALCPFAAAEGSAHLLAVVPDAVRPAEYRINFSKSNT